MIDFGLPDSRLNTLWCHSKHRTFKDVLPSQHQSNLIYEFECRNCVSRYVGRTAQRLSSRIRQHVPLHLLPEDSGARADRPTRGRPRKIRETEDLVPAVTIIAEETLSKANDTDSAAQGTVSLSAVASGLSLATADGVNTGTTVVEDSLSVAVEGTVAKADVEQSKLRPSLPRACKKGRTPQVQHTGKPNGKPKLPPERKLAPASKEAAPVVPVSGTRVVEGQSTRASLARACKMISNAKPEDMPSEKPSAAEKKLSSEKTVKKPSDYQSAVARHLAESEDCAMAYSDNSFLVVRVCPLGSNLEIMEALYIKALAPNLCVQKSSIAHLQLYRHREQHVNCIFFFTPLAPSCERSPELSPLFSRYHLFLCLSLFVAHA